MDFLLVVLGIIAVATALYFVATLVFGPGEPPQPAGEQIATPLPEGRDLSPADLRAATFPVTFRGYRMADVDALIERMAQQLEVQRALIEHPPEPAGVAVDPPEPEHEPAHAAPEEPRQ